MNIIIRYFSKWFFCEEKQFCTFFAPIDNLPLFRCIDRSIMSNQNGFSSVSFQWHVGLFNVTANQALTNTNANIAVIFYLSDIFVQQTRKQKRLGGESCDYKRFRLNKILAVNLWFEMPLMILAGKLEFPLHRTSPRTLLMTFKLWLERLFRGNNALFWFNCTLAPWHFG